jgi:hypothetical protein
MTATLVQGSLPEGREVARLRDELEQTFTQIGDRYGVSRQAAHKAYKTYMRRRAANAGK